MGKLGSVLHNFANHVTSGLSGFITDAHDACTRASLRAIDLQLIPVIQVPEELKEDAQFGTSVGMLRAKLAELLAKQTGGALDQVSRLAVHIDFLSDESRAQERQRKMKHARVHYGYNPIYRCTVSMQQLSGKECNVILEDI